MRIALLLAIVVITAGSGCVAREELLAKSGAVPVGVDLSGQWRLRDDKPRGSRQHSSGGTSVRMFLEAGERLKVTQTEDGLFISFDRSIVEEYRFGEKREISVGPVTADRVSGWEGSTYVIETLDKEGAKLVETYRLRDNGRSLRRTIKIIHKKIEHLAIEQDFDRV